MQLSDKFHNIHWKNLITAVAIPLAVGGLSAWITKDGMKAFETVNQPPLTGEVGGKAARRDFFGEIYNLRKNFTRIPPALRAISLFKGGFLHSGSPERAPAGRALC